MKVIYKITLNNARTFFDFFIPLFTGVLMARYFMWYVLEIHGIGFMALYRPITFLEKN